MKVLRIDGAMHCLAGRRDTQPGTTTPHSTTEPAQPRGCLLIQATAPVLVPGLA